MLHYLLIFFFFITIACDHTPSQSPKVIESLNNPHFHAQAAEQAYHQASQAKTRTDKIHWAQTGIEHAEQCLKLQEQSPACHFYLALNTGLYYEAKIFGYATGLARMVQAAERVNELDPSYEQGGGYRLLGKIYLESPSFSLGSNQITRDLVKSRHYLEQAVRMAPDYPENHLFLAETLIALEEWDSAAQQLKAGEALITKEFSAEDRAEWRALIKKLRTQIERHKPEARPAGLRSFDSTPLFC